MTVRRSTSRELLEIVVSLRSAADRLEQIAEGKRARAAQRNRKGGVDEVTLEDVFEWRISFSEKQLGMIPSEPTISMRT